LSETFKNLVPPQGQDEHELLEQNILKDGYDTSYPIIIWNNTIIDGHNRYDDDIPAKRVYWSKGFIKV